MFFEPVAIFAKNCLSPNFFQKGLYIGDVTVPIFDTPESFFIIRNSSNPNLSVKIELFKPFNQELFKLSL